MSTTDSACACQSRHCSLLPVPRQALLHRAGFARRRQADAPISCTPPPLCRRSGPIASSGRHHPPNGTPEKSIEPCRFTVPPAFSPTKFLWRLRAPKTLTSFACARLSRPYLPGSSSRLFRNAHHHGFWPQQLAVAWDQRPDRRTRRAYLHLQYSYAAPFGPALLVTQDPEQKFISLTLRLESRPTNRTKHFHSLSPRKPRM